jgi:hypothetical protein
VVVLFLQAQDGLLVDNAGITFTANTLTVGGAKPVAS